MLDRVNVKNITDLRNVLTTTLNELVNKEKEAKEAVEINNTAGKIISSLKVQIAYHAMRGEHPEIEFLNSAPTTKTIEGQKQKQIT